MQWAAVSTHCGWMREPPHRNSQWLPLRLTHRPTCHGHFPAGALCPPMMLTSSVPGSRSGEGEEEPSGTQTPLPRAQHGLMLSPSPGPPSSRGHHCIPGLASERSGSGFWRQGRLGSQDPPEVTGTEPPRQGKRRNSSHSICRE